MERAPAQGVKGATSLDLQPPCGRGHNGPCRRRTSSLVLAGFEVRDCDRSIVLVLHVHAVEQEPPRDLPGKHSFFVVLHSRIERQPRRQVRPDSRSRLGRSRSQIPKVKMDRVDSPRLSLPPSNACTENGLAQSMACPHNRTSRCVRVGRPSKYHGV